MSPKLIAQIEGETQDLQEFEREASRKYLERRLPTPSE
jgi:hypothetical protein